MNFKFILEGWRNALIPPKELKAEIARVSRQRLAICRKCEYNSKNGSYSGLRPDEHCLKCGCPLFTKTKSLSDSCPIGKWDAVLTDEEQYEIDEKLKG